MITMEMIGRVRRMKLREQLSNSEIAKRTGLSRNTVKKWLKAPGDQAPKYKRQSGFTKLSAFEATLVQALKADSHRPKHARRSARALLAQLQAQGYRGGYSRLTDFIRGWREQEGKAASKAYDIGRVLTRAGQRLSAATVNKLLVLLRYMFNLAIRWHTAGVVSNPTATHKLKRLSNHRERFLSAAETQQLIVAVNASPNPMLRFIIPFLLLTGARKREVLDAQWRDVDAARSFWRIPKTKSGRERHVPLSAAAIALLDTVPRKRHCDWIFANPKTLKPYVSIFSSWNTARTAAGLAEVRVHDLRHSFASFLVNAG